jgi:hypothetical protein
MTGAGIRNLVITKLEERSAFLSDNSNGPIISGGNNLSELKPVYDYVDEQLPIAANEVLLSAPIHKLSATQADVSGISTLNANGVCTIVLPDDYLRLVKVKLTEWSTPVSIPISVDHPLYRQQHNKYTRGHQDKPVVAYVEVGSEKRLECYSYTKNSTVESLLYIQKFDEKNEYKDAIAELIALTCARKIFEIFGNTEQVTIMTAEVQNVLNTMLL